MSNLHVIDGLPNNKIEITRNFDCEEALPVFQLEYSFKNKLEKWIDRKVNILCDSIEEAEAIVYAQPAPVDIHTCTKNFVDIHVISEAKAKVLYKMLKMKFDPEIRKLRGK